MIKIIKNVLKFLTTPIFRSKRFNYKCVPLWDKDFELAQGNKDNSKVIKVYGKNCQVMELNWGDFCIIDWRTDRILKMRK